MQLTAKMMFVIITVKGGDYMQVLCPLSMASGKPLNCHPSCKLNAGNGKCLLAEYLKKKQETK